MWFCCMIMPVRTQQDLPKKEFGKWAALWSISTIFPDFAQTDYHLFRALQNAFDEQTSLHNSSVFNLPRFMLVISICEQVVESNVKYIKIQDST